LLSPLAFFSTPCPPPHRHPHSFPTRRSSDLIANLIGVPFRSTIIRIDTNQGISGYGEVRDQARATYALILKSRIVGENPCNVDRSEEHTSELQSRSDLVCRLLLARKKKKKIK